MKVIIDGRLKVRTINPLERGLILLNVKYRDYQIRKKTLFSDRHTSNIIMKHTDTYIILVVKSRRGRIYNLRRQPEKKKGTSYYKQYN